MKALWLELAGEEGREDEFNLLEEIEKISEQTTPKEDLKKEKQAELSTIAERSGSPIYTARIPKPEAHKSKSVARVMGMNS